MLIFLTTLLASLASIFRSRASLGLENLALRHQIGVLHRSAGKRPKLTAGDTFDPWAAPNFREARREILDCLSRSEEHTSELQSRSDLVCRLLLEKKKYLPTAHLFSTHALCSMILHLYSHL